MALPRDKLNKLRRHIDEKGWKIKITELDFGDSKISKTAK